MRYHAVVMTNLGRVRRNNEDNFYFNGKFHDVDEDLSDYTALMHEKNETGLFAICDGMGGEALGEQAAYIAVSGLPEIEAALKANPELSLQEAANSYLLRTNDVLCQQMRWNGGLRMGTTFSALLLRDDTAQTVNLGDSRIYLIRDNQIFQLTRDHTHAQRLLDLGVITQEEAKNHPERHRLLQHLGLFPEERPLHPAYSTQFWLQPNDLLLLTSDGITDMVESEELLELIDLNLSVREQAKKIMSLALENGGRDNATLIVLRIEEVAMRDHRGIRETSQIVLTPPSAPDNPEMDEDTKPIPVLPHHLLTALPPTEVSMEDMNEEDTIALRKAADATTDCVPDSGAANPLSKNQTQGEESKLPLEEKIDKTVPDAYKAKATMEKKKILESGQEERLTSAGSTDEQITSELLRFRRDQKPPVIVQHTNDTVADTVLTQKDKSPTYSQSYAARKVELLNATDLSNRQTVVKPPKIHKSDIESHEQSKQNEDAVMKRSNEEVQIPQRNNRPIRQAGVRRPVQTDRNGLTADDMRRFRQAQEQAKMRQAEHAAGEAGADDAPVLPGHASRVTNTGRTPAPGRTVSAADRQRERELELQRRRRRAAAAAAAGHKEPHQAARTAVQERKPRHNVGREGIPVSEPARKAVEPQDNKRPGGFLRNFIFFLVFVLIGFILGWVVLNIGKFF